MNHRAKPIADDWPTRRAFVPQGADQQGRQEPTIPCKEAASAVSGIEGSPGYEPKPGEVVESADRVMVWFIVTVFAILLTVWLAADGPGFDLGAWTELVASYGP